MQRIGRKACDKLALRKKKHIKDNILFYAALLVERYI